MGYFGKACFHRGVPVALITIGFLVATAKTEERENIAFVGAGTKNI